MPTYEFKCSNGHVFDRFYKKISDGTSELTCPECGAVAERQLSAGAGLLFKGSGFYLTDYGKNAHRTTGSGKREEGGAKREEGSGQSEGTKAESSESKSESGKSESGTGKAEGAKLDVSKSKSESPSPKKSEGAKPKKE